MDLSARINQIALVSKEPFNPCTYVTCVNDCYPCSVGSRLTHIHLLSGGILPLLSLLESTLARHAHTMTLSKEVCSLKVVRMRLDDGRRLIGVRYPLPLISEIATLLSSFKHGKQVNKTIPIHGSDNTLDTYM